MTLNDYLRAVRRRWPIVFAAAIVATTAGWFVTGGEAPRPPSDQVYGSRATVLSLRGPGESISPGITSLQTVAALTTIGEVPKRVAQQLGSDDPQALVSRSVAVADSETGFIVIEATAETPRGARRLASTFAMQLVEVMKDRANAATLAEIEALDQQIAVLRASLSDPRGENGGAAAVLRDLLARRQELRSRPVDAGLELIDVSTAVPERAETFQAPRGRGVQVLAAGIVGLLLGLGLALALERFDLRIRNVQAAERHFALPVLAEIPSLPRRLRGSVLAGAPMSKQANAFRLLAAALVSGGPRDGGSRSLPSPSLARPQRRGLDRSEVILVTSAGPAEGKTTVVANLAAALAEGHRTVTVISCDFHRPDVHRLLGVTNEHGLAEALAGDAPGPVLNGQVQTTAHPNIRVVPSGEKVERPGELLSSPRLGQALAEAKRMSDIVLLDSAPLLTAGESAHLLANADAVLVVARAGKVTPEIAERTGELLKRLRAPVAGVALTFARETPMPPDSRYYR